MAEISAGLVKQLREVSGAGMMDCKKALAETAGDLDAAVDWLRKKGLASAAKKAGRVAAEGLVGMIVDGRRGALVEVNSETDFVARNELFQEFVRNVTRMALDAKTVEDLAGRSYPGGGSVTDKLTQLMAVIGENLTLRRLMRVEVAGGAVAGYVHNAVAPGMGKIGILIGLESTGDAGKLVELGRQLAMHVAAAQPQAIDVANLDPAAVERERGVLAEQARASGKPEEIIAKMVEGRLRKYYEEVVLLEQVYVVDGESRVKAVIEAKAQELGSPIKVAHYARMVLGEGVERAKADFAAEVSAQLR